MPSEAFAAIASPAAWRAARASPFCYRVDSIASVSWVVQLYVAVKSTLGAEPMA
jgi:hypothetical protein